MMIDAKILTLIHSLNQGAEKDLELSQSQLGLIQNYQDDILKMSTYHREKLSHATDEEFKLKTKRIIQMLDRVTKSLQVRTNAVLASAKGSVENLSWQDNILNQILSDINQSKTQIIEHQDTRQDLEYPTDNQATLVQNSIVHNEDAKQSNESEQNRYLTKLERMTVKISRNLTNSIKELKEMKLNLKITQYGTLAVGTFLKTLGKALGPGSFAVDSAVDTASVFANKKVGEHSQNKLKNWDRENNTNQKVIESQQDELFETQKKVQDTQKQKEQRLQNL